MNHHHQHRCRPLSTFSPRRVNAAVRLRAQALVFLACFALTPIAAWADFEHQYDHDCLPNQPGCLPNGEIYLGFNKPATELKWELKKRGHRWVNAWRSHLNTNKPWRSESYDPNYVHPTTFEAVFSDQCQTQADWDYYVNSIEAAAGSASTYRYTVDGVVHVAAGDCYSQSLYFPGEGIYDVKLEVFAPGASTPFVTKTTTARVRDYLIVLLGDSAASGEGSPDYQRPTYGTVGTWVDRRCHRSANAAVPLAVQQLEYDPHSTVTFLNFACSGATLNLDEPGQGGGILSPYAGIEPTEAAEKYGNYDQSFYLMAQVDQLDWALRWKPNNTWSTTPRKVDMLLTTGGINDVRFSKLALACVLLNDCHNQATSLYGSGANPVKSVFDTLVSRIPDGYVALRDALEERGLEIEKTYVMQYPDAFENEFGNQCTTMLEDVLPALSVWNLLNTPVGPIALNTTLLGPFLNYELGINFATVLANALTGNLRWSSDEINWMVKHAMPALDGAVRKGAKDAGFEFVDGIQAAFARHGYCAKDNWIRRAVESSDVQGPWNIVSKPVSSLGLGIQALTKGLMHPAPAGYAEWAKVLWPTMKQLWNGAPVALGDNYILDTSINASFTTPVFSDGVLSNDVDPNGDPLWAVLVEGPKHGKVEFGKNGHLTYTPNVGYRGYDSLYYVATDGGLTSKKVRVRFHVTNGRFRQVPTVIVAPGQTAPIGPLVTHTQMSGPFEVRFDREIPIDWGYFLPIPGRDGVFFTAPDKPRKRRLTLRYSVHSLTEDRTSPDYGRSIHGALRIRIANPRR